MKAIAILLLLASGVVRADPPPSPSKKARVREIVSDWWLWTVVATLAAGTIVTSVVVATRPGGVFGPAETSTAVTIRF